ncbi:hypothetical protein Poli38472_005938 [Pythium oligandrum]|uniref:Calcineurin-like phosphoesterase domain-containing protein n=1 Tax=Pythium oligandrum TaxID=41045 RepID=A0A8K1CS05_PYTOL|nr:hypothetical protein Poli38472_005938 [Pythium oligandrum]|eukprot:TMW68470.1 hypothetical protein Poli38472_005938 [Pythium oligandrum]
MRGVREPLRVSTRPGRAQWLLCCLLYVVGCVFAEETASVARPDVEIQQLVVTDVDMVQGFTLRETLDQCANRSWVPVGVNWVDERQWASPTNDYVPNPRHRYFYPEALNRYVYLCLQQAFQRDVKPHASIVQSIVIYEHLRECPPAFSLLFQPRDDVIVCVKRGEAYEGFKANQFIADVMITTEEFYNNEVPGWMTLPASLHVDLPYLKEKMDGISAQHSTNSTVNNTSVPSPKPSGNEEVGDEDGVSFFDQLKARLRDRKKVVVHTDGDGYSERRVYLSLRRPVRPITQLRYITDLSMNETFTACEKIEAAMAWERPGFGYLERPGSTHGVLCVQRSPLYSIQHVPVLLDLVAVRSGDECPTFFDTHTRLELHEGTTALCLQWGAWGARAGAFVADLSIHRTRDVGPRKDMLPGDWKYLHVDLNQALHGIHAFLFYRSTKPRNAYDALVLEQYPEKKQAQLSDKITGSLRDRLRSEPFVKTPNRTYRPPLMARPRYTTTTSGERTSSGLSFRILQLADLHYTGQENYDCREAPDPPNRDAYTTFADQAQEILSSNTYWCREVWMTEFVQTLLDLEQPDFVVFTGDNVHVDYQEDRLKAMDVYSRAVEERGIPWAMIFGNHDETGGYSKEEMLQVVMSKRFSHVARGPTQVDGVGNYELNILAPAKGVWGPRGSSVFRMYFLDSHADIDEETQSKDYLLRRYGYEWIQPSQVEYYKALSRSHMGQDRVPSIMFFHIPLPEYNLASKSQRVGTKGENIASPAVNSGLFSALLEMNDVKATFCGHDHVNDFCYHRQGIQLCYGGVTGMGRAYANYGFDRRARVIEWEMDGNTGKRTLRTWKRFFQDPTQLQQFQVLYTETSS